METKDQGERSKRGMPIDSTEDVEYSAELADVDDVQSQARAEAADERQRGRSQTGV